MLITHAELTLILRKEKHKNECFEARKNKTEQKHATQNYAHTFI
jgi:hypothetical protein